MSWINEEWNCMASKVFSVFRGNMLGGKINTTKNYAKVDLELNVAKTKYL